MSNDGETPDRPTCGHPTKEGAEHDKCRNPPTEDDGFCWIHSDLHDGQESGRPGGRPDKLTPERQARICELLANGHSIGVAASKSGIAPETYYRWKNRGRDQDSGRFAEFHKRTERARYDGQHRFEEKLIADATGEDMSFGKLMELLRKRYPDSPWNSADSDDDPGALLNVMLSDSRDDSEREYKTAPDDA